MQWLKKSNFSRKKYGRQERIQGWAVGAFISLEIFLVSYFFTKFSKHCIGKLKIDAHTYIVSFCMFLNVVCSLYMNFLKGTLKLINLTSLLILIF